MNHANDGSIRPRITERRYEYLLEDERTVIASKCFLIFVFLLRPRLDSFLNWDILGLETRCSMRSLFVFC